MDNAPLERATFALGGGAQPLDAVVVWQNALGSTGEGPRRGTARLWVLDCAGDQLRVIGQRSWEYRNEGPDTVAAVHGAGLRVRRVAAGGRAFLRVDVTTLSPDRVGERALVLEVEGDTLRDRFDCTTSSIQVGSSGGEALRREIELQTGEDGPRILVRQQGSAAGVTSSTYTWRDAAFRTSDQDLCAETASVTPTSPTPANQGPPT